MNKYKMSLFKYDKNSIQTLTKFLMKKKIISNLSQYKMGWTSNVHYFISDMNESIIYDLLHEIYYEIGLHSIKNLTNKNKTVFQKNNPYT